MEPPTSFDPCAEILSADTFLCRADDGSAVVLKRLEADCLHQGRLHPKIRDRLSLVRGVAHPRLATFRGVELVDSAPFQVWSFVAGEPVGDLENLEEFTAIAVCRSIVAAVRTLHSRGLVHGSIHPRNVIRTDDGEIWLTHVSPYLYDDPAADIAGVARTIDVIAARSPELRFAWEDGWGLEEIDAALTRLRLPEGVEEVPADEADQPPSRWRWALVALIVAVAAVGVGMLAGHRLGALSPVVLPR